MATVAGTYKKGDPIIVTYQAVACATGKTITATVYGEDHLDSGLGGAMAEIGETGRYWKAFTPDQEGEWIVTITNTTDGGGDVVKAFAVCDHSIDDIGDTVALIDALTKASGDGDLAAMKVILDAESGVKAVVDALNNFDPASDPVAVVSALTDHTPQTGDNFAIVNGASGLVAIKTLVDSITAAGPTQAQMDAAHALLATPAQVASALDTYDAPTKAELDTSESNIRGADSDTLKTLSEQLDAVSAPAMVG